MVRFLWLIGLLTAISSVFAAAAAAVGEPEAVRLVTALELGEHAYAIVTVGSELLLGAVAILRYRAQPAFGLAVPAETIVAFGIFSLVIGLAVGLSRPLIEGLDISQLTLDQLRPIGLPFIHGLVAAACAPFVAMLLRNYEADALAAAEAGASAFDIRDANVKLARELETAQANVSRLNAALAASTDKFGESLQTTVDGADRLSKGLVVAANSIGGASDALTNRLKHLESTLRGADDSASEAAQALAELRRASTDARILLDALATLIESVNDFVGPDDRRRP